MGLRIGQVVSLTFGLLPVGCYIDTDNPCRDNEVFDEVAYVCVCQDGYALTADGCVKCGKHEVVQAGACVCEEGYARTSAGSACKEAEEMPPPAASGDAGGETMADSEGMSSKLSAEGAGTTCADNDACSGFPDATSCDGFLKVCAITGCSLDPDNCPDDYACCDVSAFAPGAPNVCIEGGCPTF